MAVELFVTDSIHSTKVTHRSALPMKCLYRRC